MKQDTKILIKNFVNKQKENKLWRCIVLALSCIVLVFTFYKLVQPAKTEGDPYSILKITDEISTTWKTKEWIEANKSKMSYDLKLHYVDENGVAFKYNDQSLTLKTEEDNTPYGFGGTPNNGSELWGEDLIDTWNIRRINVNNEQYLFQYAEVLINNSWHRLNIDNYVSGQKNWHLWCNDSWISGTEPSPHYRWTGNTMGSGTYNVEQGDGRKVEYKFVYKKISLGVVPTVTQADTNIKMNIFDYENKVGQLGINTNGVEKWFNFRGGKGNNYLNGTVNENVDQDGYLNHVNRVLVNNKLIDGYPVFLCRGQAGCNDFSLGYLFGSNQRPVGTGTVTGVTQYNPTNTLLKATTVNGITTYSYNSKENAVDYDISQRKFFVRPYTENGVNMTSYTNEAVNGQSAGEYMPFTNLESLEREKKVGANGLTYYYEDSEVNHWHGLTMSFDFHMPKDGTLGSEEMVFEFHGDDDVWVYIDNVLVLDIGGTHGAVKGKINFHTGIVTIQKNFNGEVGTQYTYTLYELYQKAGLEDTVEWQVINGNKVFANFTDHKFNFFYLERGAVISNCRMKFNMPPNPGGGLSVRKEFEGPDKYDDKKYTFKLYKYDDNNLETKTPVSNAVYTLNGTNQGGTTNENGEFSILRDDVALFKLNSEEYYFLEEIDTGDHAIPKRCNMSGLMCQNSYQTGPVYILPDETIKVVITNQLRPLELKVEKEVLCSHCDENNKDDTTFNFSLKLNGLYQELTEITVDGKDYEVKNGETINFSLKDGESIIMNGIPYGTSLKLTEENYNGYNVIIKDGEGIQTLANGNEYEFTLNTPQNEKSKSIKVVNMPGRVLPETGGPGIYIYLVIGLGLILTSIIGGTYIFFHKEEGGE